MSFQPLSPPKNEAELLERSRKIAGLTFFQLACALGEGIPHASLQRKGLTGRLIERSLGAMAASAPVPDFVELGVELKTLPLNGKHTPSESTFITTISLKNAYKENWLESTCYKKIKRILWVPVEGDPKIPFQDRRVGNAFLWSPSATDLCILEQDWQEAMNLIALGRIEEIDARLGQYLQVRPKGADGKALTEGYDLEGNLIKTLPRGFYLRSRFTAKVLQESILGVS